ncbi:Hypothetical protein XNRR2_3134 [Streptomyces albidoflavus]|uniref:hypothetical protein n=1 Tax=Streptomyces TaxID=1883 RepID=UPI0001AED297|nr:hypothetical protein [Streptomyces albidoflavus]BDH52208.1 hypothetical protein MTP02_32190 [Streptomyces albus]AGI89477.1 Hypothetical protein XNR_3134 [Streptomyces albidoflavus]EFE82366.1 predicted protein [Streptomyces albidoflavus]QLP93330.1 Hypothetical protein XNRR2_3134 [Streptomyces albidoflavus]WAE11689.1 Hypothetical protein SAD14_3134 [Streptomyces albidoflavus]
MSTRSERRWAELARDLEFTRLPELRRQAEGWRTGLTGLTTLFAILVLLKGRDNLSDLPEGARATATGLLVTAFVSLTVGSLLAARAAHGAPEREILLGGQSLRRWTEQEVARVTRALAWAYVLCVLGVVMVVGALGVAWLTTQESGSRPVVVRTNTGVLCGDLIRVDQHHVDVRSEKDGEVSLPWTVVVSVKPGKTCD